MNADLSLLLTIGLAMIAFATTALVLLVRGDLAPSRSGGRWFLGAALGFGIIAFSIKLVIIATLSTFPGQTIAPLLPDPAKTAPTAWLGDDGWDLGPKHYVWKPLPMVAPAPADNPTTPAKVALGERLFLDTALSANHTVSCASCHDVGAKAGTDRRPTAIGITGVPGPRNAPTVWNAAFQARLFWDGRAGSLEEQAKGPPLNPGEMGMPSFAAIEDRIKAEPTYQTGFADAFGAGQPITMDRIVQAIAAYERTLITPDAPYDRFVKGDPQALNAAQQRGMWLFQSVGCVNCHAGPNFSGASLIGPQNPYAPLMASRSEYGRRHDLTADKGRAPTGAKDGIWRIPSLRNVAATGPYFHNGSVTDLKEAVRVMATSQLNAQISDDIAQRRVPMWSADKTGFDVTTRRILSTRDVDDIVAFLGALTSDRFAVQ